MKNLYFNDFEDLACSVSDTYASLKDEGFDDIAIIAKYEEAKELLSSNRDMLEAIAKELLDKETIDAEEFQDIMNRVEHERSC